MGLGFPRWDLFVANRFPVMMGILDHRHLREPFPEVERRLLSYEHPVVQKLRHDVPKAASPVHRQWRHAHKPKKLSVIQVVVQ